MNGWWKIIISTFGLAAISGLVAWGSLRADVNTLKDSAPANQLRMERVEQGLSRLTGVIEAQTQAAADLREAQQKQIESLDSKIDLLLQKSGLR